MAFGFGKPKVVATTNEDNIPANRCARPACGRRVSAGQKRRNFGTCGARKCLDYVQKEALKGGDVDGHDANAGRTVKSKDGKVKYKVVGSRKSGGTELLKLAPIDAKGRVTRERVTKRVTDVEEL